MPELVHQYQSNEPCPHISLTEFLNKETALDLSREFSIAGDPSWTRYKHITENTFGKSKLDEFPPLIGQAVKEFMSPQFVAWMSELTGIPDLLPDPMLDGGGMHQTKTGGFLNVHADFGSHHYNRNWQRRCNLLLYLNEHWEENWGGSIELWDEDMKRCVVRVAPYLNTALIFTTTEKSFHGYPTPIRCPSGVTRNSLALYYYTADTGSHHSARPTRYRPCPEDGMWKRILIFLNNILLTTYSWLKRRLGLSDRFASWILGKISRK